MRGFRGFFGFRVGALVLVLELVYVYASVRAGVSQLLPDSIPLLLQAGRGGVLELGDLMTYFVSDSEPQFEIIWTSY